jgi:CheY-like chemotaxis protein
LYGPCGTHFNAHGYNVLTASSGKEALETLVQRRPDLLLLDLLLPGMNGLEVCRQMRANSSIPIIVLSVRDAECDKVEALDPGADDYIARPFGIHEVLARIRVALRRTVQPLASAGPGNGLHGRMGTGNSGCAVGGVDLCLARVGTMRILLVDLRYLVARKPVWLPEPAALPGHLVGSCSSFSQYKSTLLFCLFPWPDGWQLQVAGELFLRVQGSVCYSSCRPLFSGASGGRCHFLLENCCSRCTRLLSHF